MVRSLYGRFFWWSGTSGDKSSDPPASSASIVRTRRSQLAQTCHPVNQAFSASVAPTLLVSYRRRFERMAVYDRRPCMGASLPIVMYCLLAVLAHQVYEVGKEGILNLAFCHRCWMCPSHEKGCAEYSRCTAKKLAVQASREGSGINMLC